MVGGLKIGLKIGKGWRRRGSYAFPFHAGEVAWGTRLGHVFFRALGRFLLRFVGDVGVGGWHDGDVGFGCV